jgi:hypothetical protein
MFVWAMAGSATSGKVASAESIKILMSTIISCSLGRDEAMPQVNTGSGVGERTERR